VDLIRKKGRICVIGLTGKDTIPFPWDKAAFRVCDVIFNLSTSYTSWDRTIHLIATEQIPAGKLITHRLSLSDWRHGFEELEAQRALKVLLIPE
jgi:L-iditol 2-dehydrogenase